MSGRLGLGDKISVFHEAGRVGFKKNKYVMYMQFQETD